MKKAIVTGASGFVGRAICMEMVAQGINVIAVVRNENSNISGLEGLEGVQIVYCDLKDIKNLDNLIADRDIDAFYHLAWTGTAGQLRGDLDVQIANVQYTCDAVRVCNKLDCPRFVYASSIMEYEIEETMKMEVSPGINTLYSSAKLAADYMARTVAAKYNIDFIKAVISNIYGCGEISPRLINTSIRKMINGEHCAFSAGEQLYDFIYITDAAKAFVGIGKSGISNRTYYIGSLNPKPLKEFLCEMRDVVDPGIEIGLGEIPFNGVSLSYKEFDINAVKNDTGVTPNVSFKEGIQLTVDWIKEN